MNEYANAVLSGLGLAMTLLGIVNVWLVVAVNSWRASITELRNQDAELRKDIGAINILVAGQYVTDARFVAGMKDQREQVKEMLAAQTGVLISAIDRIDKKLDGKADR